MAIQLVTRYEIAPFYMRNWVRYACIGWLLALLNVSYASFNKNLWPIWQVNNPLSTSQIDHSAWQKFLDDYLCTNAENVNLLSYKTVDAKGRLLLKYYLKSMANTPVSSFNRKEQLAYWINVYNALTVDIVTRYYPVNSVQEIHISPGLFAVGPWSANVITINGISLSLDEIHNRIIRPIWNDSRTHYAINNGSIGAANLRKKAFNGETIEAELTEAAYEYINSLRGVQVIDKKLVVSKIYDWFRDDFGGTDKDIIFHLKQFAKPNLYQQLDKIDSIESYVYNWHLNNTYSRCQN